MAISLNRAQFRSSADQDALKNDSPNHISKKLPCPLRRKHSSEKSNLNFLLKEKRWTAYSELQSGDGAPEGTYAQRWRKHPPNVIHQHCKHHDREAVRISVPK